MTANLYAAIDCGTNSTRLLISDGSTSVERLMRITRLGAGVDRTGRLDPDAMERTFEVLREYRAVMDAHDVAGVRIAATSAARDAANSDVFFGTASQILGTTPELLSGAQEAELSFLGATSDLPLSEGLTLVFDIGGGSTEFAVGYDSVLESVSVDVGCVRMTEKFIEHDPPLPEELSNTLSVVSQYIDDVVREAPLTQAAVRFVGLAGTVSTVAAVEIGLQTYDRDQIHHFVLTRPAVEDVFRTLATEALEDRVHNPGLERERADVIVGGCCVLAAVVRYFGIDELIVSESDILDGLILSQIG
ncbi:MAG: Ppx/GppA family phosphatase [Microthrixaceae bacterium]|nr:Ppx/GppA family phosphatase [Microthrixaceae bacterium]